MAPGARLSYNNVVKSGLPPKDNRRQPVPAAHQQEARPNQTDIKQSGNSIDWAQQQQDNSGWYELHKQENWDYSYWVDAPKELVIYWQQGVCDALDGKEPATMAAFFDQLERGLLPAQQQQRSETIEAGEAEGDGWQVMKVDIDAWQINEPSLEDASHRKPRAVPNKEKLDDPWAAYGTQLCHRDIINIDSVTESEGHEVNEQDGHKDGWHEVSTRRKSKPHRDSRVKTVKGLAQVSEARQRTSRRRYR